MNYLNKQEGKEATFLLCCFNLEVPLNAADSGLLNMIVVFGSGYNDREETEEKLLTIEASTASIALAENLGFSANSAYAVLNRFIYRGELEDQVWASKFFLNLAKLLGVGTWDKEKYVLLLLCYVLVWCVVLVVVY